MSKWSGYSQIYNSILIFLQILSDYKEDLKLSILFLNLEVVTYDVVRNFIKIINHCLNIFMFEKP